MKTFLSSRDNIGLPPNESVIFFNTSYEFLTVALECAKTLVNRLTREMESQRRCCWDDPAETGCHTVTYVVIR